MRIALAHADIIMYIRAKKDAMPRSNPRYYLAPTAVSITPNANNSANNLAVYIAKGTKIKVCDPHIPDLRTIDASFQEWTLAGRNRRLADTDSTKPYTIYARLRKTEHTDSGDITHYDDAYLVFAEQRNDGTLAEPDWQDPYVLSPNTSKTDTMQTTDLNGEGRTWAPIPTKQVEGMANTENRPRSDYWWLKLGTVSAPDANNKRTVDFDPGILDTDQYNADWELEPDALPLRVDLDCTVNGREAGAVPCVYWGTTLRINAHLIEGWEKDRCDEVALWTIRRDTGNAEADEAWNDHNDKKGRTMNVTEGEGGGYYEMAHLIDADAFDGVPSTQFVITAWGYEKTSTEEPTEEPTEEQETASDGSPAGTLVKLASTALTVQAETVSIYSIDISSYIDIVTVDDAGNLIGSLYTTTTKGGNAYRTYRIHAAITVRKDGDPLLYEDTKTDEDGNQLPASRGHYAIHGLPHNCQYIFDDSTIYITHIDNIKDGEAGTADDDWTPAQYEAMRKMDSCSVDLVADCEGVATIIKNFPVAIKHDSQPYIGAVLTNMSSGISWNSKEGRYIGLPVTTDVEMWHNDEYLSLKKVALSVPRNSGVELQIIEDEFSTITAPSPDATKLQCKIKKIKQKRNGKTFNIARVSIEAAPQDLPPVVPITVSAQVTYSGVDYERQLTHTLNKTTDMNIYQVKPSVKNIHVSYNANGVQTSDVGTVTCRVTCDSTDDKHYDIILSDGVNKQHRILATSRIDTIHEQTKETVIGIEQVYDERNAISVDVATMRNIRFTAYTVNDAAYLNMSRSELDALLRDKDTDFLNSLHEEDSQDVPLTSIEGTDGIVADLRNEHFTLVWSTRNNDWRNLNAAQTTAAIWRANQQLKLEASDLYVNGDTDAHKIIDDNKTTSGTTDTFTWKPAEGQTDYGCEMVVTFNRSTGLLKVTRAVIPIMPKTIVLTLELTTTNGQYTRRLNFIIDVQRDGYSFELLPIDAQSGKSIDKIQGFYNSVTDGYIYTTDKIFCALKVSDDDGSTLLTTWGEMTDYGVAIGYVVTSTDGTSSVGDDPDSINEHERDFSFEIDIDDNVGGVTFILYKLGDTGLVPTNEIETVPVVRDGKRGAPGSGANAVRIDLDNEADILACDSDGKVRFARTVIVKARILDGARVSTGSLLPGYEENMTQQQWEAAVTAYCNALKIGDVTPTLAGLNPTTHLLTSGELTISWAFAKGQTVPLGTYSKTIQLKLGSETFGQTFTLTTMNIAAVFQLWTSKSEAAFNYTPDNTPTPASIDVQVGWLRIESSGVAKHQMSELDPENKNRSIYGTYGIPDSNGMKMVVRAIDVAGVPIPTQYMRNEEVVIQPEGWDWVTGQNKLFDCQKHDDLSGIITIPSTTALSAIEFGILMGADIATATEVNILDHETIPIVWGGANGAKGDVLVSCFRWYKDDLFGDNETPVIPESTNEHPFPPEAKDYIDEPSNAKPEDTWSQYAINRPATGMSLWMSQSTQHIDYNGETSYDEWNPPVRISGADGTPGEDGKEREWIYQLGTSSALPQVPITTITPRNCGDVVAFLASHAQSVPSTENGDVIIQGEAELYLWNGSQLEPTGATCSEGDYYELPNGHFLLLHRWHKVNNTQRYHWYDVGTTAPGEAFNGSTADDFVPAGWYDNALVINETDKFLFGCWRDYDHGDKVWGDFQGPTILSSWGHNGIDGDGVEYVHVLTDKYEAPTVYNDTSAGTDTDSHGTNYAEDEYLPRVTVPAGTRLMGDSNYTGATDTMAQCTDDEVSPSEQWPYAWVLKRTMSAPDANGRRSWGRYTGDENHKMSLWHRWSKDGVSPTYTYTEEAWGPSADNYDDIQESAWQPATPARVNGMPYLWRRSVVREFRNGAYVNVTDWVYTCLSGTNGESIKPKGGAIAIVENGEQAPAGTKNGDIYLEQNVATPFIYNGTTHEWTAAAAAAAGDCYVITESCMYNLGDGPVDVEGYMFIWVTEGTPQWLSLGPFKGDDGKTYYTHIAWTDQVTLAGENDPKPQKPSGQTSEPNALADNDGNEDGAKSVGTTLNPDGTVASIHFSISPQEGYDWMGVLVNTTEGDPTRDDRGLYTWKYVKGAQGGSPWMADLNNEFDGVICDASGYPVQISGNDQTVQTTVKLWHGSDLVPFTLAVYDCDDANDVNPPAPATPAYQYTSGTKYNGVTPTWSNEGTLTERTFTASFGTDTDMNDKRTFCLQLTSADGTHTVQYLFLVVSGVKPGANGEPATLYNLVTSVDEITTRRMGAASFDPSTASLTCGYRKVTGTGDPTTHEDVTGGIDSKYYIYYRRRKRATASTAASWEKDGSGSEIWYRYGEYKTDPTKGISNFDLATYDKVQFIIYNTGSTPPSTLTGALTAANIVDRETVPVIADGADGGSVKADLDNENEIFLYDSEGHRVSAPATSQATLYDAASIVTTDVTWSIDTGAGKTHGVNVKSASAINDENPERYTDEGACWITTSGLLHVVGMLWDDGAGNIITDAEVFIVGTYNGLSYRTRMTLHKQIGGVKYALRNITPNAISYDSTNGTPAQTTISATVTRTSAADNNGVEIPAPPPIGYSILFCRPSTNGYVPLNVTDNPTYNDPGSTAEYVTDNADILANGREVRIVIGKTTTSGGVTIIDESDVLDSETIPLATAATGPAGPSVTACINPNPIVFNAASDGIVSLNDNKQITIGLTVDGNPCVITKISDISCVRSSGTGFVVSKISGGDSESTIVYDSTSGQVANPTLYVHPISDGELDGSISMTVTGIRDNKTYSGVAITTVTTNKQGPQGGDGQDAATVRFGPSEILFNGDASGAVANDTSKEFTVRLQVPNGDNCNLWRITNISKPSNLSIQYKYGTGTYADVPNGGIDIGENESHPYEISFKLTVNGANITGHVTMIVTGKKLSKSYTATGSLPVSTLKQGTPGTPGTTWRLQAEPSTIHFGLDFANNASLTPSTFVLKAYKSVGGETTEYDGTSGKTLPDGVLLKSDALNQNNVLVEENETLGYDKSSAYAYNSVSAGYKEYRLKQGNTVLASCRVTFEQIYQRMLVPSGTWNATTRYYVTDRTVPLVLCEADGKYYYLDYSRISNNPVIGDSYAPNKPSTEQFKNPWHEASEYEVVLTKMLIAKYGNIGSAIFYREYMYSTNGYIGTTPYNEGAYYPGTTTAAYTYFDSMFPDGKGENTVSNQPVTVTNRKTSSDTDNYQPTGISFYLVKGGTYKLRINGDGTSPWTIHLQLVGPTSRYFGYIANGGQNTVEKDLSSVFTNGFESGTYTIYAENDYNKPNNGIIQSVKLIREDPLFAPNWYVNLLTGKMSAARGNFVVDANGDVHVEGTIRADNFYHGFCLFQEGGCYSPSWWRCEDTFIINNANESWIGYFTAGKYYTSEQMGAATNHQISGGEEGLTPCTGNADVICAIPSVSNNWGSQEVRNKTVMLPDPADFPGKVIEIRSSKYGNSGASKTFVVGCIQSNSFVRMVVIDASGGITKSSTDGGDSLTVNVGDTLRIYSVPLSNGTYKWFDMTGLGS